MCEFISFWHQPSTGDIAVSDLMSHSDTYEKLKLNQLWREAHYTSFGKIDLRFDPDDHIPENYEENFRNRFPSFVDFFNYCMMVVCENGKYSGGLILRGLTSAEGLKLPKNRKYKVYLKNTVIEEEK